MQIKDLELAGLKLITPDVFEDERGYFYECYNKKWLKDIEFVQANHVLSMQDVIRGLHYQAITATSKGQIKLVRAIKGTILDIVVDIRKDSPTLGQWTAILLSAQNKEQLLIPLGFAHGYRAISGIVEVQYLCSNFYNSETESGIKWDDPDLAIKWDTYLPFDQSPILSERDSKNESFKEYLASNKRAI